MESLALENYPRLHPRQWTLDRKDNTLGHSVENTVVSCLGCNLRRRSRDHESFLKGSRLTFKKQR